MRALVFRRSPHSREAERASPQAEESTREVCLHDVAGGGAKGGLWRDHAHSQTLKTKFPGLASKELLTKAGQIWGALKEDEKKVG
jgi:hypothetical protein